MPEKVAVLTGASSGFGLLTSVELAKAGFRVIASMRDLEKRERLLQAAASAKVSDRIDVGHKQSARFGGGSGRLRIR